MQNTRVKTSVKPAVDMENKRLRESLSLKIKMIMIRTQEQGGDDERLDVRRREGGKRVERMGTLLWARQPKVEGMDGNLVHHSSCGGDLPRRLGSPP